MLSVTQNDDDCTVSQPRFEAVKPFGSRDLDIRYHFMALTLCDGLWSLLCSLVESRCSLGVLVEEYSLTLLKFIRAVQVHRCVVALRYVLRYRVVHRQCSLQRPTNFKTSTSIFSHGCDLEVDVHVALPLGCPSWAVLRAEHPPFRIAASARTLEDVVDIVLERVCS